MKSFYSSTVIRVIKLVKMVHSEKVKSKSENESEEKPNLKGDYGNICLLFLFYVLQGDEI